MGREETSRNRRHYRGHIPTVLLLLLINADGLLGHDLFHKPTSHLKKVQIVRPQRVDTQWHSHQPQRAAPESLTYSIEIDNTVHLLNLTENIDFLSPDFTVVSHDVHRNSVKRHKVKPASRHYYGHVSGYEDSLVALSTCEGLRGVIFMKNKSYALEPVLHSINGEHILFLVENSQAEPFICGADRKREGDNDAAFDHTLSMDTFLRKKRNLPQSRYVELVLVVDNLRFQIKKSDRVVVREEMVQLANLLDTYFKQLNIRIVLVGLEIFETGNPFNVEGSASEVLGQFSEWRKMNLTTRVRNDMAQLVVGRTEAYSGGILGMAYIGTLLSRQWQWN